MYGGPTNSEWFYFSYLLNFSPSFHLSKGLIGCASTDVPSGNSLYHYPLEDRKDMSSVHKASGRKTGSTLFLAR